MPKQHIQKYMTRHGAQALYSRAVRARGDLVFFQGQTGMTFDGGFVGKGDPFAQADHACRNIKALVEEAGGTLNDVCKITVYVTDVSYRPAVYSAINAVFEGVHQCSTGVVVSALAHPDMLVEIEAMAVIEPEQPFQRGDPGI
jgi:enamine deaminase RidA (YjgF/YER057c/UK114 family)